MRFLMTDKISQSSWINDCRLYIENFIPNDDKMI